MMLDSPGPHDGVPEGAGNPSLTHERNHKRSEPTRLQEAYEDEPDNWIESV